MLIPLDFALHESGSRSRSIRPKVSLAESVTMTVKGQFGGSPQNGDALSAPPHGFGNCQRATPVPILRRANQARMNFANGCGSNRGRRSDAGSVLPF